MLDTRIVPKGRGFGVFLHPKSVSLPPPAVDQLLDVVHHAIKVPLRVDFLAPAQAQPRQRLVVPDVAKHRLHRADALALQLSALG